MAVRISYNALRADPASLKDALQAGLGSQPGALGIVLIEDLPDSYPALRTRLLRHAAALAALPEPAKRRLESPETTYSFGWSHGKEVMNGRPDTAKGSFYANPLTDRACVSAPKRARYPEYFADNIWPDAAFAAAFKALGALVAHVGIALADACDATGLAPRPIAPLIKASQCHKARLLHYFPAPARGGDDACGTHIDHSLLTALCSALYLQPRGGELVPVPPPSADAGLWIYPRGSAHAVKVQIPADCLAFQTGEALQVLSEGRLAATPHYVSGGTGSTDVSRETFAFFLQPDVDDVISAQGETFGQFTKRVLARHYSAPA
ncbi:Clavaminate synthase-like protein [Cutaneotrichosporon oleaginosum]|uniref:Clavaminate synthase-like protein n=1 Tax=Cutaneotrichosporon oleaginosum TaxID=879819 RepID=A0A0J0XUM0_9TREE|nr:Clavaminate synthase-like protein [Cutaneotrichosporon oleaginosum]KLT44770.1 Clavaminate synthase-like protein [Cutaneotrichosporon oleaginosum]